MGGTSAKLKDSKAISDFLHEASIRLGISKDRLTTAVRASQALSKEELEVMTTLAEFARAGTPMRKRSAVSRGILSAIRTIQEARGDPFAEVDDPMDDAKAAKEISLAEAESQAHREAILKECVSAAEAAELTGRSRQVLERLRRERRLLALRKGNQWQYPRWQFDSDARGGILYGIEEVFRILDLSPLGTAFWLLEPYEQLGGSPPIELLRQYRPEPVIQLAREHSYMP